MGFRIPAMIPPALDLYVVNIACAERANYYMVIAVSKHNGDLRTNDSIGGATSQAHTGATATCPQRSDAVRGLQRFGGVWSR